MLHYSVGEIIVHEFLVPIGGPEQLVMRSGNLEICPHSAPLHQVVADYRTAVKGKFNESSDWLIFAGEESADFKPFALRTEPRGCAVDAGTFGHRDLPGKRFGGKTARGAGSSQTPETDHAKRDASGIRGTV